MVEPGADEKHEKDEAWIAKYRAAVHDTPVKKSRFGSLLKLAQMLSQKISSRVSRILAGSANADGRPSALSGNLKKTGSAGHPDQVKKRRAG